MSDYTCRHGEMAMGRDCAKCDCEKRAHAFIQRSEGAEKVELPGWLARKIAWYILYLEGSAVPRQASNRKDDPAGVPPASQS